MSLEAINRSLFAVISAPADLSGLPLWLATLAAKGSILVLAALVAWTWLLARPGERRALERLVLAVPLALALNYVIVRPRHLEPMLTAGHHGVHDESGDSDWRDGPGLLPALASCGGLVARSTAKCPFSVQATWWPLQ